MSISRFAIVILVFLFCIIFSAKIIYAETDPYNFTPNPSFEEGTNFPALWTQINGWACHPSNESLNLTVEWNNSLARTGSKSIGFKNAIIPAHYTGRVDAIISNP